MGDDGLATVTGDRLAARVGSEFSDIRDVIQVRLHRGELVEVLGEKEFGSEPGSGTWYKIAPPSGEFRWVFGKYVDPDYLHSGVRKAPGGHSPLVAHGPPPDRQAPVKPAGGPEDHGDQAVRPSSRDVQTAEHWSRDGARSERRSEPAAREAPVSAAAEAERVESEAPPEITNKFVEPAHDPSGTPTLRRLSPQEFQAELDEIDMELGIMLAEEPTVWKFDELVMRAEALLTEAETAVERGRARLLINRIAQSEDVKRRYDTVNGTYALTERHNRQLAELRRVRDDALPRRPLASRFDGVGRLERVVPSKLGAPRYALLDDNGDVRCYVTPAPGVNINAYVGRRIGVSGIRGYIAEKRARHVTAKHVTTLDQRWLR